MTKRFSQANPVVVPVAQAHAAAEAAAAAKVAAVAVEVEAAAKADAAAEKADEAPADAAVIALTAPAPMAMVAEPVAATQDTATSSATTETATSDERDYTPYIVGGVLLAGGILAVALSGDDDNGSTPAPTPAPTPTPTNTVTFSSAATATIAENTPAGATGNVVLDVNAAAAATGGAITYTLGGTDASFFTINASTGEIRFVNSPNFEATGRQPTYSVTVTASSAANGTTPAATATQALTITVTNVNEAPTFASATVTATPVAENIATSTVVYTAAATDPDANTTLTYSLGGADAAAFAINATTGAVTFRASPDFETKSSYTFTVTATDAATGGLSATQTVTLAVTNVNEAPTFANTTTAFAINENVPSGTTIGTFAATDPEGAAITYSLTGAQAANFAISNAGVVTITQSPDFETRPQYTFNVVATDASGQATTRAVTLNINDIANEGVRIDGGTIPAGSNTNFDAANGNVTFLESGTVGNISTINNFTSGDIISTDVATNNYSFSSVGTTLTIVYTANGVSSQINLPGAAGNNFIFNETTAEQAVGFDFFRTSAAAPPSSTATLSGTATLDALNAAVTYRDDAGTANVTTINNFSSDDRIEAVGVNGTTTTYSFSSIGRDLVISFNNGQGVSSQITLVGAVINPDPNLFVFDEATAERAAGFDFFRYG